MKKMTNSLVLGSVLAASVMSGSAMAGSALTGNVGVLSDYFYRGIDQGISATANGGVDYDFGTGVTIGTWAADVADGLEVDLYGAYSGNFNQFDYSIGFTTYNYTGDTFDDTYQEINLNAGTGPVNLEFSTGSHDLLGGGSEDYTFIALSFEQGNAYGTYGTWDSDAAVSALDGSYIELGYGLESGGFDVGIALIRADKDLSGITDGNGKDIADISLTFSLGKSFDL